MLLSNIATKYLLCIDVNVSIESHFDSDDGLIIDSKRMANFYELLKQFIQFANLFEAIIRPSLSSKCDPRLNNTSKDSCFRK